MQEALEYISEILNEHVPDDDLARDYWRDICDECYRKSPPPHPDNSARDAIALLREAFYARLPVGTRVDDAICEIDTSMYDRVHSFLEAQTAASASVTSPSVTRPSFEEIAIVERVLMQYHIPAVEVSQAAGCIITQLRACQRQISMHDLHAK